MTKRLYIRESVSLNTQDFIHNKWQKKKTTKQKKKKTYQQFPLLAWTNEHLQDPARLAEYSYKL